MGANVIHPGGIVRDLPRVDSVAPTSYPGIIWEVGRPIFSDFTPVVKKSGARVVAAILSCHCNNCMIVQNNNCPPLPQKIKNKTIGGLPPSFDFSLK